jgi:thiamine transporter
LSSRSKLSISDLTASGMAAALALVLGYLKLYQLPQGGSITLAAVPILYLSFWRGPRAAMLAGLLCGLLSLIGGYIIHPVQLLLDYPLPFALLGVAGAFDRVPRLGILIAQALRCSCHIASGVIFFASYAPEGVTVWHYAALYNLSFILPEALISMIAVPLLRTKLAHVHEERLRQ